MKRLFFIIFIFCTLCLTGCGNAVCLNCGNKERVVLTCADYGNQLEQQGVEILKTGQTYTLTIPSDAIFFPDSPNFNPAAETLLKPLTEYLRCYETTYMKISGFTDNQRFEARNRALSERQAQRLEDYLSKRGLDARMIYAIGFGSAYPIGDNNLPRHRNWNNRIEIKFRKVVVPPIV